MAVDQTPGLVISPTAQIGSNVTFGAHVVVHDGVVIGDDATVGDHAILGKPPTYSPRSSTAAPVSDPLVIGAGARIGTMAIVFAGTTLAPGVIIGDRAFVRERARIGEDTIVGQGSAVDNDVVIGARVRIQSMAYVTGNMLVEDDVFIGPGVTTTNDDAMGRIPRGHAMRGPVLRRACRIGGGATLVPGVEVGEEAFVAAGAVVTNDVPPRGVVMGVPARVVRRVPDEDLIENWRG